MIVRPSRHEDMSAIVELVRLSFAPRLHPYMIYTQFGIAHFLRAMVDQPALFPDRTLLTCEDDLRVIGFAEFRVSDPSALLSYICVSPDVRRRGVATAMITAFLDDHPELTTVELDVFEENRAAVALYRKMGFSGSARTLWFARAMPQPRKDAAKAIDPVQALTTFHLYGFCELPTLWQGSEHRLGRIGPGVLRCFTEADYADEDLLGAMRYMIPSLGEALLIQSAEVATPLAGREVNAALRLSLDLASAYPGTTQS